jgi:hypothetical protein
MSEETYKTTNTTNYEVSLGNTGTYGYFEHNTLGDESAGGLWFVDGELVDYDGVYRLPKEVAVELKNRGVDTSYLKEREVEKNIILSIDELVDFYMKNNKKFKSFEVLKAVDEQGNVNSTVQDIVVKVEES